MSYSFVDRKNKCVKLLDKPLLVRFKSPLPDATMTLPIFEDLWSDSNRLKKRLSKEWKPDLSTVELYDL